MTRSNESKSSRIDDVTVAAIEEILRRGNDAEVKRRGEGCIVLEVKKTIKYSPPGGSAPGKSNRSFGE